MKSRQPKSPSPRLLKTLGQRFRDARTARDLSLRDAAAAMKWSFGRLQSFETDETVPSVSDVITAADLYAVDKVWLAFGGDRPDDGASVLRGGSAFVTSDDGGVLTVPSSVLAGAVPPFRATTLSIASLGSRSGDVAIYRPGAGSEGGLHVASIAGRVQLVMGVQSAGKRILWMSDFDVEAPKSSISMRGVVVAMLRAVEAR